MDTFPGQGSFPPGVCTRAVCSDHCEVCPVSINTANQHLQDVRVATGTLGQLPSLPPSLWV